MHRDRIFKWLYILGGTFLVWSIILPLPSESQVGWLPNQAGKWKPLGINLECCRQDYKLTQSEYDAYMDKLKCLAMMIQELRVLNPPLGFEASLGLAIKSPPHSSVQKPRSYIPVVGWVGLGLTPYAPNPNGGFILAVENWAALDIYINILNIFRKLQEWEHGDEMGDEQGVYHLVPKVVGNLQGFPIYDTSTMVITKSQKPLWLPVSQERFLRHALRRAQDALDAEKKAEIQTQEEHKRTLQNVSPEMARKLEEDWREGEKTGQEMTAQLREGLEENPGNIRFLRADYVKALTQELASLSPEQRATSAYYCSDWMILEKTPRPSGLLDPGAPQAQRVVYANPDFYNPTLPRTAIQAIVAHGIFLGPSHDDLDETNPAVLRAVEAARTLDWKEVAALVE